MRNESFFESVRAAWAGLVHAWARGGHVRFHWLAAYAVLLLGVWLGLPAGELALLVLTSALVLAAELVNTAVEEAANLAADSFHPLARAAKDVAAGAVLVAAVAAVAVGGLLLLPRLPDLPASLRARLERPDALLLLELAPLVALSAAWLAAVVRNRARPRRRSRP